MRRSGGGRSRRPSREDFQGRTDRDHCEKVPRRTHDKVVQREIPGRTDCDRTAATGSEKGIEETYHNVEQQERLDRQSKKISKEGLRRDSLLFIYIDREKVLWFRSEWPSREDFKKGTDKNRCGALGHGPRQVPAQG